MRSRWLHRRAVSGSGADLELERRHDMARQPTGRDQHGIGTQIEGHGPRIAREPMRDGAAEDAALAGPDRLERGLERVARLHLDEGDGATAPHDEVDLAALAAVTARQRAIALEHEKDERRRLRAKAAFPGAPAAIQPRSHAAHRS